MRLVVRAVTLLVNRLEILPYWQLRASLFFSPVSHSLPQVCVFLPSICREQSPSWPSHLSAPLTPYEAEPPYLSYVYLHLDVPTIRISQCVTCAYMLSYLQTEYSHTCRFIARFSACWNLLLSYFLTINVMIIRSALCSYLYVKCEQYRNPETAFPIKPVIIL